MVRGSAEGAGREGAAAEGGLVRGGVGLTRFLFPMQFVCAEASYASGGDGGGGIGEGGGSGSGGADGGAYSP